METKNEFAILALFALIFLLLAAIAFAIPNSLTLQGKLTNTAGTPQQGTFNFTFNIYDNITSGNLLWSIVNQSVSTDANGVYDVILSRINLSFTDQYYLGISVQGENESVPRINLTSAPYSFRANISEALNPNASYFVSNLSVSGNATIGSGSASKIDITTKSFNFSSSTGNLNINGTVTAVSFVGDGSLLTGISQGQLFNSSGANVYLNETTTNLGLGLTNPSDRLVVIGNIRISGSLNASSINITGNSYFATSSGNVGIGTSLPQYLLQVANATNAVNLSGVLYVNGSSGNVGIGTTSPSNTLTVVGSVAVYGSLNATFLNATEIRQAGNQVQTVNSVYNLANFTSNYDGRTDRYANTNFTNQYDNRADRYSITNYSNEYANTGFKISNGTALPFSNFGLANVSNTTSWSNIINIPAFSNFQLSNVSNTTSWSNIINIPALSNFQLANVSNNTLVKGDNESLALWNKTSTDIYTRETVKVNISNLSVTSITTFTTGSILIIGNINITGSLNITGSIGATRFTGKIDCTKIDGGSDSDFCTDATGSVDASVFNLVNLTSYFGDSVFNNTVIRRTNTTFFNIFSRSGDFDIRNISNYTQYINQKDFNLGNISNNTGTDIQVFTTTGANTWTKPTRSSVIEVILIGAGGGGGSGRKGASGSTRSGGSAGGGGGLAIAKYQNALVGSSVTVTIGTGGTAGASQTTDSTNGNAGTAGGATTFGSLAEATGGGAGSGGTTGGSVGGGSGGGGGQYGCSGSTGGAGSDGTGGANNANTCAGSTGGGGGGGIDSGNTASGGGVGGASKSGSSISVAGGTAGGVAANGGAGNSVTANTAEGGTGGGGGGAGTGGTAGTGGAAGARYGGGGGGGGAGLDASTNSGAGGAGANGIAIVITYS